VLGVRHAILDFYSLRRLTFAGSPRARTEAALKLMQQRADGWKNVYMRGGAGCVRAALGKSAWSWCMAGIDLFHHRYD
jgi:hypothetical protein